MNQFETSQPETSSLGMILVLFSGNDLGFGSKILENSKRSKLPTSLKGPGRRNVNELGK